jgi:hypothetical protein
MNQAQKILFDLGALKTLPGATFNCDVLFDAEGKPYAGFTIVGKNSPEYRSGQRELRIDGMQRAANRSEEIDTKTAEGAQTVVDSIDEQQLRTACSVVTGWYGFGADGNEVPFDKSQLPNIFQVMPDWQARILAALEKQANFMPVSSNG